MNKVLVFAVHPDDETLGCGGTLLKHKHAGDEIYWLIGSHLSKDHVSKDIFEKRNQEIEKVAKMYDFNKVIHLDFLTTEVDTVPMKDLVKAISDVFNEIRPDTVYLPFCNDVHTDHRILFDAAYSSTKIFRHHSIKRILMMETISETDFVPAVGQKAFVPNVFIDISDQMDKKIEIIKVYESELGEHPFARSVDHIKALSIVRGAASGFKFAEAFMLLKEVLS